MLADFDDDLDPTTGAAGVGLGAQNLSVWKETWGKIRWGDLDTYQAVLAWDDRVHKGPARYVLSFAEPRAASPDGALVFSLSQSGESSLPAEFKGEAGKDGKPKALDWTVVLVDAAGREAKVPLSADQPLYPQIVAHTRRLSLADTSAPSEIVMRSYRLPMAAFARANPQLDLAAVKSVRFDFDRSPRGSVVLDDVGISGSSPRG